MKLDHSPHDTEGNLTNGQFQELFQDGSVCRIGHYQDEKNVGEWKYYRKNGLLKAIGKYSHGLMTGEWKWYRENGQLMQTGSFLIT